MYSALHLPDPEQADLDRLRETGSLPDPDDFAESFGFHVEQPSERERFAHRTAPRRSERPGPDHNETESSW